MTQTQTQATKGTQEAAKVRKSTLYALVTVADEGTESTDGSHLRSDVIEAASRNELKKALAQPAVKEVHRIIKGRELTFKTQSVVAFQ